MCLFVEAREEPPQTNLAGSGMTAGRSSPWQHVLTWSYRKWSHLLLILCLTIPLLVLGKHVYELQRYT